MRSSLRRGRPGLAALAVALVALAAAGCEPEPFRKPLKLGGQVIPPEVLNRGRAAYTHYCRACHGDKGDGRGPAASGMRPPPRDFTLGRFKFAAVPSGELPHDEDLERIVKRGLAGTAMLPWDVPDDELRAIVQYLKTFSKRWQTDLPGEKVVASPDPWQQPGGGGDAAAIARGRVMYHAVECWACHPAYATRQEIYDAMVALRGAGSSDFREDMYGAVAKETEYKSEVYGGIILPPDFTWSEIRSGTTLADLYRTIASGVGGTAMPQWKGSLPEKDIWAMVHYVKSLVALRGTPAAQALRARLLGPQPPLRKQAPAPAADGGPDAGAAAKPDAAAAPDGGGEKP